MYFCLAKFARKQFHKTKCRIFTQLETVQKNYASVLHVHTHALNFKHVSSSIYLSGTPHVLKLKLSTCVSVYRIGTLLFIEETEVRGPRQNPGSEHAQGI